MTAAELAAEGRALLKEAGVEEADRDAVSLLQSAAGWSSAEYLLHRDEEMNGDIVSRCRQLFARRSRREPLQQILGEAWFMGLPFRVNRDVLVPRQDTETLAEAVLNVLRERQDAGQGLRLLDLCTGSGCLAVSLAKLGHFAYTAAADRSAAALETARENARLNGCRIRFFGGDLFSALPPEDRQRGFDVIVCNPPYIPTEEIPDLMPEVSRYEPAMALDGGPDGLAFYRRLTADTADRLTEDGLFFWELGAGQAEAVRELLETDGRYGELRIFRDLGGHERVISGGKQGNTE